MEAAGVMNCLLAEDTDARRRGLHLRWGWVGGWGCVIACGWGERVGVSLRVGGVSVWVG